MKIRGKGSYLIVIALFSLFSLIIFWPIFLGKINLNGNLLVSFYQFYGENLPFKDTGWDQLRIYFPFYKVTQEAFRSLSLPFWNPYAFSGHPHFADFQTAVLYPLNIFGIFLPQVAFWHLLRISPTILASFFTFVYLKNLKLSTLASFFGALIFGFSPYLITWGEEVVMSPHSIIFLPLVLLSIDKLTKGFNRFYFFVLALAVCFSVFAGYLQTTIYLLVLSSCYLIYRAKSLNLGYKFYALTVGGFFLGIIISSVQLLPSIQLFFNSQRSGVDYSEVIRGFLLPFDSLITYFSPDFFGNPATRNHFLGGAAQYYEAILFIGIAPLLFSLLAFLKKRNSLVIFFIVSALLSLLTVIDSFFSRFFIRLPIPLVSTAIPHRILFIPAFSFAVLGAVGFDLWLKNKKVSMIKTVLIFASFYLLIFVYLGFRAGYFGPAVLITPEVIVSLRNLAIPLAVFVLISFGLIFVRNRRYVGVLIIVLSALNIFYFSNKYLSFSDQKYVFPQNGALKFIMKNQGIDRTLFVGDRKFSNNFSTQYSIFNPEGYDSLNNGTYSKFIFESQKLPEYYIALRRSDAELGFKDLLDVAFSDKGKRDLLNVLGVRYLVAAGDDREIVSKYDGLIKVFSEGEVDIFENETALARTFLSSNLERFESEDMLGAGKAQITLYTPLKVQIKTNSSVPKYLVLTDNYYDGWGVRVNGKKAQILKASSTFKAVRVEGGEHEVEFYFDSKVFKLGALISLLGVFALIFITSRKNQQRD